MQKLVYYDSGPPGPVAYKSLNPTPPGGFDLPSETYAARFRLSFLISSLATSSSRLFCFEGRDTCTRLSHFPSTSVMYCSHVRNWYFSRVRGRLELVFLRANPRIVRGSFGVVRGFS